jgi:hypothetical protein
MVNDLLLFVDYGTIESMNILQMSHKAWILISGLIWAVVGCLLLYKGLQFLAEGVDSTTSDRASWLIAIGLFLGFLKGRFVLRKTVERISLRIVGLQSPVGLADAYPKSYWLLLASMMALGFLLRLVPLETRGFIDVVVGSALLNGAILYVRAARTLSTKNS